MIIYHPNGGREAANTTAILLNQQTNTDVGCNTVDSCMHGFRFYGLCNPTKFWDNTMKTGNTYVFTLDQNGMIGQQGTYGTTGSNCTSNNNWEYGMGGNYWDGINNGQYMTFCNSSNPTQSPLVVINDPKHPELNPDGSGFLIKFKFPYQHSSIPTQNSIFYSKSDPGCTRCNGAITYLKKGNVDSLFVQIADGSISLPNDEPEKRLKVMQQQLFEMAKTQPSLAANSKVIQGFVDSNETTTLGNIHNMTLYLAQKDLPKAKALLTSWKVQDELDENYSLYFKWRIKMLENTSWKPSLSEVYRLASKCPVKAGTVVYAARNLHNLLTGKEEHFANTCTNNSIVSQVKQNSLERLAKTKPVLESVEPITDKVPIVFPNPAFTQVKIECKDIQRIELSEITGRIVLEKHLSGLSNQNIDISKLDKGMYFIKIVKSDNSVFVQKLIKE